MLSHKISPIEQVCVSVSGKGGKRKLERLNCPEVQKRVSGGPHSRGQQPPQGSQCVTPASLYKKSSSARGSERHWRRSGWRGQQRGEQEMKRRSTCRAHTGVREAAAAGRSRPCCCSLSCSMRSGRSHPTPKVPPGTCCPPGFPEIITTRYIRNSQRSCD